MDDVVPVGLLEKLPSKDSMGMKDRSQGMSIALHFWVSYQSEILYSRDVKLMASGPNLALRMLSCAPQDI